MGAGVPPGLQNRVRRFRALGGFDSHTFPPEALVAILPTLQIICSYMEQARLAKFWDFLAWIILLVILFPLLWTNTLALIFGSVMAIVSLISYNNSKRGTHDQDMRRRSVRLQIASLLLIFFSAFHIFLFKQGNFTNYFMWDSSLNPVRLVGTSHSRLGKPLDASVYRASSTALVLLFCINMFTVTKAMYSLFQNLRSSTRGGIDLDRNQYLEIQRGVSRIHFYLTSASALMMIIVFVSSFTKLAFAFVNEASRKMPPLDSIWIYNEQEGELIIDILSSIEILIVAPLPYLLMLGLGRYINEIAIDNDSKRAKRELLDLKAFEVSLLIAIVATAMISTILSMHHAPGGKLDLPSFAAAGILLVLLIIYFYILETQEDKAADRKSDAFEVGLQYLANGESELAAFRYGESVDHLDRALVEFCRLPTLKEQEKAIELYCRGLRWITMRKAALADLDDIHYILDALTNSAEKLSKLRAVSIAHGINLVQDQSDNGQMQLFEYQ